MAIDLKLEKECEFSAQDRYDIISAAVTDSYDDGFMNQFIFERALYCYALAAFSETDEDSRIEKFFNIHSNPLVYWTENIDEITTMIQEHKETLNILAEDANLWYEDYTDYAYSMRGMLDNLGDIMGGVTQMAQDELVEMQNNGELQSVLGIADKWGINNEKIEINESLFVE